MPMVQHDDEEREQLETPLHEAQLVVRVEMVYQTLYQEVRSLTEVVVVDDIPLEVPEVVEVEVLEKASEFEMVDLELQILVEVVDEYHVLHQQLDTLVEVE